MYIDILKKIILILKITKTILSSYFCNVLWIIIPCIELSKNPFMTFFKESFTVFPPKISWSVLYYNKNIWFHSLHIRVYTDMTLMHQNHTRVLSIDLWFNAISLLLQWDAQMRFQSKETSYPWDKLYYELSLDVFIW